jgi:uncharacterized protein (DUF433 family)
MSRLDRLSVHPPPFRLDTDGVVRIGQTRVTIDSVLGAYRDGCTVEQIVMKFPSLDLADTYAVIAYYLWNQSEIDAYLAERQQQAVEARAQSEARSPSAGLRERLLSRSRRAS